MKTFVFRCPDCNEDYAAVYQPLDAVVEMIPTGKSEFERWDRDWEDVLEEIVDEEVYSVTCIDCELGFGEPYRIGHQEVLKLIYEVEVIEPI